MTDNINAVSATTAIWRGAEAVAPESALPSAPRPFLPVRPDLGCATDALHKNELPLITPFLSLLISLHENLLLDV